MEKVKMFCLCDLKRERISSSLLLQTPGGLAFCTFGSPVWRLAGGGALGGGTRDGGLTHMIVMQRLCVLSSERCNLFLFSSVCVN